MPKVVVQYPNTEDPSPADVVVHWSKEASHVQLSISRYPFGVVAVAETADKAPILEPRDLDAEKPDNPYARDRLAARGDEPVETTVYSDPMTRHQLNEMIRTLRRARDAAFGADA